MDKYKICRIWGDFRDSLTEARYFEHSRKNSDQQLTYSVSTGIIILWLYSVLDFILLDKPKALQFMAYKTIPTVTSFLLVIFARRIQSHQRYHFLSFLNTVVFIAAGTVIFLNNPGHPLEMAMTQIIFIMGISLIIPNNLRYTILVSVVSTLTFGYIDIFMHDLDHAGIAIIASCFLTYNIFLYFYSRKIHFESRLKFRELIKEQKYIIALNKEINKRAELEKKLTELACIDYLTEVSNRRYFMDIAEHEFEKIRRSKEPLSLMLLDIDNFKTINDTYGHSVGDMAIKKLVEISRRTLRKTDFIGRIGGEEFAILCINSTKEQTVEVAGRLCRNLEEETRNLNYHFTASIGVTDIRPDHPNIDKALHLADLALYEAKRTGKNRVVSA